METPAHHYYILAAYSVTFTLLFLLVCAYVFSYLKAKKKYDSVIALKNGSAENVHPEGKA